MLNGDVDGVDESDDFIENMTLEVCLGQGDRHMTGSVEVEMRRSMIDDEITTLMLDAAQGDHKSRD
jgi:hypothetical protein